MERESVLESVWRPLYCSSLACVVFGDVGKYMFMFILPAMRFSLIHLLLPIALI